MTASKWKNYVKSTFEKDNFMKRESDLSYVPENNNHENNTPAEMLDKRCMFEEKTNMQNSSETSGLNMRGSKGGKRKIISKFSKNEADDQKENTHNLKNIKFAKKS